MKKFYENFMLYVEKPFLLQEMEAGASLLLPSPSPPSFLYGPDMVSKLFEQNSLFEIIFHYT